MVDGGDKRGQTMRKQQYGEYVISTATNYTCTHWADHVDGVSHDTVSDFLRRAKWTPRGVWDVVRPLLKDSPSAYLILDDSVQDKRYAQKIALVKRQSSGAEHGLVDGIGMVNLVHSDGEAYYPLDYRVYSPDDDGKTKNDHFRDMRIPAITDKRIQAKTILFDSWYAGADNLTLIVRLGLTFITTLKSNRLVSLGPKTGSVHLADVVWTDDQLHDGQIVPIKEVPFDVRLCKIVAPNGDIEWVITNDLRSVSRTVIQQQNDVRWQIEQMHRELKQLTGLDKCQCRKGRSQRNHIACCYHAWIAIKVASIALGKTLYHAVHDLFDDYLRAE